MKNYFDVPIILGSEESGVKLWGSVDPVELLVLVTQYKFSPWKIRLRRIYHAIKKSPRREDVSTPIKYLPTPVMKSPLRNAL